VLQDLERSEQAYLDSRAPQRGISTDGHGIYKDFASAQDLR
jgi:hypothetical protein